MSDKNTANKRYAKLRHIHYSKDEHKFIISFDERKHRLIKFVENIESKEREEIFFRKFVTACMDFSMPE